MRGSVSWTSRGRGTRVDLHPAHLARDLLHCGRRAIVLGIGGLRGSRQVYGPLVVWLGHRRPLWSLGHGRGSILDAALSLAVLTVGLRRRDGRGR